MERDDVQNRNPVAGVSLTATIDRIEADQDGNALAVLVFEDGQQLVVPFDRLPDDSKAGSVLSIAMTLDQQMTQQRLEQVRSIQSRLFGSRKSAPDSDSAEN
jgi:hypothetical protein